MGDDEVNDAKLIQAMRRRILGEISKPRSDAQSVVNNVYGGGVGGGEGGSGGVGGLADMSPEDRDYFVDIVREDLPEINEHTGKPKGWRKKVHRFSTGKGEDPEKKN